ncbi:ubiquitin fusion degradation protein UFD1-domain-containing protein [Lipomyces japonicus]|uniref:ubiquitin fusion degradation protein UFD1-domain-containing protein n=1 Tax=Lipomyces japonicus TaxID=56871 RepID=UPI0034CE884B
MDDMRNNDTNTDRFVLVPRVSPLLDASDRIVLPQSVLESLVGRAGQGGLASPLTFTLFNPATGATTHCGVREFSAPDNCVLLSQQLASALGINKKNDIENDSVISVEPRSLPKGTFVSLRPLGTDYLVVDDWKALLEASLHKSYTTLTEGQTFVIKQPATQAPLTFLVDKLEPEPAVCIIETDLVVDIVPISADQAEQSVRTRHARRQHIVPITVGNAISGSDGGLMTELTEWDRTAQLTVSLTVEPVTDHDHDGSITGDDRSADFFISVDQPPTESYFLWSSQVEDKNQITISPSNAIFSPSASTTVSKLLIAVETVAPVKFTLSVTQISSASLSAHASDVSLAVPGSVQCSNCSRFFPSQSLQIHSAFCARNNVPCPQGCGRVFRRQDGGVPVTHWHCEHDHGTNRFICDSLASRDKHVAAHHATTNCSSCGASFSSRVLAAYHRATTCPFKLHTCRFCHLELPQEPAPESQFDLLAGYSGHESHCSTRTTECARCGHIVRLRDMDNHLQLHDLQRVSTPTPVVCANNQCVRVVDRDAGSSAGSNPLSLCTSCFGPLYSPLHDPDGTRLRARIERRYFVQLTSGCKRAGCLNRTACAIGRANAGLAKLSSSAQVAGIVKELMNSSPSSSFNFCVDDSMTRKRQLVEWIADDAEFAVPWICRAVAEAGIVVDDSVESSEGSVRNWLNNNGVRITEVH